MHQKLIHFAASLKGCIEHIVHPRKSYLYKGYPCIAHDNTINQPGGLKAVAGGLLQFKPLHGHNVVVVPCLKHLFCLQIAPVLVLKCGST